MKKLFITLIIALASAMAVPAQDIITQKNGQDVKAIIEEIGGDYVKFKHFEEPDGPVIVLKKNEIFRIKYQSGRVETFKQEVNPLYDSGREPVGNIRPGMKYKELKTLYNPKDYVFVTGEMAPGWAGLASFIIPGLGQGINNEWGRAAGHFFGSFGLLLAGSLMNVAAVGTDADGYETYNMGLGIAAIGCYLGVIGIDVWSIIDAIKVTKVNNMYKQDLKKKYAVDINLVPSVNYAYTAAGTVPSVGMTLAFRF